jgi:hypothetical protein
MPLDGAGITTATHVALKLCQGSGTMRRLDCQIDHVLIIPVKWQLDKLCEVIMKQGVICGICTLVLFSAFAVPVFGGMASRNYHIQTTVVSGGGGFMESASYRVDSTVAQPSCLMDQDDPPYSTSYDLYPGFWYTIDLMLVRLKPMPWLILLLDD